MTPEEFRDVRIALGVTQKQLAALLETAPATISNIESPTIRRRPPPRIVQLMEAYAAGYRPEHWPTEQKWRVGGRTNKELADV